MNDDEKLFWRHVSNTLDASTVIKCNQVADAWYREQKDNPIMAIWFGYASKTATEAISYTGLTQYAAKSGVDFLLVNTFRRNIYDTVRKLVLSLELTTEDGVSCTGSDAKDSDIDITVTEKNPERVTLVMAYTFGLISMYMFGQPLDTPATVDTVFIHFLEKLSRVADMCIYSSNGAITGVVVETSGCLAATRYLSRIQMGPTTSKYQLLHKPVCEGQNILYAFMTILLLTRLVEELKKYHLEASWLKWVQSGTTYITNKIHRSNAKQWEIVANLLWASDRILQSSLFDRFKTQIISSSEAGWYADKLVSSHCSDLTAEDFCTLATKWEKCQLMANIASPEASWTVHNFIATVYNLQMTETTGRATILSPGEYWLVHIENLCTMIHHLRGKHLRKAYKYAMRACTAHTVVGSAKMGGMLTTLEYDTLRGDPDKDGVHSRLTSLMHIMLSKLFTFPGSPYHVTGGEQD
jgi:hypothetical protein